MHHKPTIGILVVTHNQFELTAGFVDRFLKMFGHDPRLHLLVLDNNSSDGTYERIRSIYPRVDIRKLNDNYGCVTGRNIGIVELCRLGCEYVYISDNDIIIEDKAFFVKLSEFHELHSEIDASCPVVLWGDDRSVQTLGTKRILGTLTRNVTIPSGIQRLASLPGCAQFVRIAAFKRFGLYDNDFTPVSIEDFEWGIRATSMGAVLVNNPEVQVIHLRARNRQDSVTMQTYYLSGRMKFLRKHFSVFRLLVEIRFWVTSFRKYGLRVLFHSYLAGLRAQLTEQNYVYERFVNNGLEQYYVSRDKASS